VQWEVYRARDTRLNRDAALKILPEGFASDAGRAGGEETQIDWSSPDVVAR
jgi:hypothetical protein